MESNLIYRDVTVALLKDEEYPCENDYDEGFMAALDRAIWIVEKYTASAKPKQRWIPCSERLPEDEQEILFSTKTGRVHSGRYHDDHSANQWFSHRDRCRAWNNVVNAWMPLPEPYKEAEE